MRPKFKVVLVPVLWLSFAVMCVCSFPVMANTMLDVSINTAAVSGKAGAIRFDFTTSDPGLTFNVVDILNFAAAGALGLPITQGGLVSGDIILGANPAAFTSIESHFTLNELLVPFISFGNSIAFSLSISSNPPVNGDPPDEFSLFLLGANGLPLFPTSDPLGADSVVTVDVDGSSSGLVSVFSPASLSGQNVNITVPGTPTPEPSSFLLLVTGLTSLLASVRRAREN